MSHKGETGIYHQSKYNKLDGPKKIYDSAVLQYNLNLKKEAYVCHILVEGHTFKTVKTVQFIFMDWEKKIQS